MAHHGEGVAMSMTKKDYELISDVLTGCYAGGTIGKHELEALAKTFATILAIRSADRKFDRKKFLRACGVTD
jgi:hypothetical protein